MSVETDDLRPPVELREGVGQYAIAVLGGVLVDQRRSGCGVTGPAHQFRQCAIFASKGISYAIDIFGGSSCSSDFPTQSAARIHEILDSFS